MNPDRTPKLGQCDLLYGSVLPAEKKWAWIGVLKPAERHSDTVAEANSVTEANTVAEADTVGEF